ncbi:Transducin-like enhancer protein 4 [Phlyctochytrium planicorne]|nr:Transducin-like enhancer protein 4 [Phlyctochytrium planicorne]
MHGQDQGAPPPPSKAIPTYDGVPGRHMSPQIPNSVRHPIGYKPVGPDAHPPHGNGYYETYPPAPGPPTAYRPPPRLMSLELLDKIRDDILHLDARVDVLSRERADLQAQYNQFYDLYYKEKQETAKYIDINNRYQAIITQLLPMLTPPVQEGVRQDMESIQQLAFKIKRTRVDEDSSYAYEYAPPERTNSPHPPASQLVPVPAPASAQSGLGARPSPGPAPQPAPPAGNPPPYSSGVSASQPSEFPPYPPPAPRPAAPQAAKFVASLSHGEVVCAFAMTNPFEYIFTGGKGIVKAWYVKGIQESKTARCIGELECLESYIRATKLTNDGKLIVAGEVNYMVVCDITTPSKPKVVGKIDTPNVLTYALASSSDSKFCFSCCSDGSVQMWDINLRRHVRTLGQHESTTTCCALTPDGQRLITGSLDKSVKVWDIVGGKEIAHIIYQSPIYSLGYCPIQPPRVTVGLEKSIDIRNISQSHEKKEITGVHKDCVLSVRYSQNGSWFISTGKDKKWVCWKTSDYSKIFELPETSSILCSEISDCGEYVATGSGDNVANIYVMTY